MKKRNYKTSNVSKHKYNSMIRCPQKRQNADSLISQCSNIRILVVLFSVVRRPSTCTAILPILWTFPLSYLLQFHFPGADETLLSLNSQFLCYGRFPYYHIFYLPEVHSVFWIALFTSFPIFAEFFLSFFFLISFLSLSVEGVSISREKNIRLKQNMLHTSISITHFSEMRDTKWSFFHLNTVSVFFFFSRKRMHLFIPPAF